MEHYAGRGDQIRRREGKFSCSRGHLRGEDTQSFRVGPDTNLPKRSPVAGTMDQVRPQIAAWRLSE